MWRLPGGNPERSPSVHVSRKRPMGLQGSRRDLHPRVPGEDEAEKGQADGRTDRRRHRPLRGRCDRGSEEDLLKELCRAATTPPDSTKKAHQEPPSPALSTTRPSPSYEPGRSRSTFGDIKKQKSLTAAAVPSLLERENHS